MTVLSEFGTGSDLTVQLRSPGLAPDADVRSEATLNIRRVATVPIDVSLGRTTPVQPLARSGPLRSLGRSEPPR